MADPFFEKCTPEPNTGCWIWIGSQGSRGYGTYSVRQKRFYAHRRAWELAFGPIPSGMHVCHRCDTPACVNPQHLFVGTAADNGRDRDVKHRTRYRTHLGESHGRAKLSADHVAEIRRLYVSGNCTQRSLARRFGVSQGAIFFILSGRNWKADRGFKDGRL